MDDVDVALVKRLGVAPFLSGIRPLEDLTPTRLAKDLGISIETVRRRLAALTSAGVLAGRSAWPNTRHLGLHAATLHFRLDGKARKSSVLAEAAAFDGVLAAFDFVGPDVCVDVCFRDEADRANKTLQLQRLLGAASAAVFLDFPLPIVKRPLTPLDWRILQALRGDADCDLQTLADALHVSRRTVRRRVDAMVKEGSLDVVANFDPGQMDGHLLGYLLVHFEPQAGRTGMHAVLRALERRWIGQWSPPDRQLGHLAVVLVVKSPRELEDMRREVESMAHVAHVEALLLQGARPGSGWLDAAIASHVQPRHRAAEPPVQAVVAAQPRRKRAAKVKPARRRSSRSA